ncbi:deoxyhypusine hydroxylase-like [Homarus americanus]|uniref:Deoxyhypusine hydroxylase n=1 Tax=Homarus americanus TaxID=6706 RepID=A0A8J5JA74_HOMAM|nr:deoxyhypusine hydroxylase-like [Homarus americanus]XP_042208953.1 deoxyhypusine hydroxylase-like [Homarus americanus]XP_042208954.1 deoxyhypusine hydroxylase-like [Homarus americanus]KAG7153791.1 Deoxyhypusine hydroxylase-like [Homarus americanus]
MVPDSIIEAIGQVLEDQNRPLKERFRALFTLKNLGGEAAIVAISQCFSDPSALLKHESAYCLGQMGDTRAIPTLTKILKDVEQEPIVRHEAGEALGAIGDPSVLDLLRSYSKDPVTEVAETCQLAVGRIEWFQKESNKGEKFEGADKFFSVDPTPPATDTDVEKLRERLLEESLPLFDRYRAMFSLRNLNTPESAKALAAGFKCSSALFRHEIGFVLGQMSNDVVVKELTAVVQDENENEMVRHEAAEALGSIATVAAMAVLKEYQRDKARVVRESCEVALDMSEYENSSEFQYADGLLKIEQNENGMTG